MQPSNPAAIVEIIEGFPKEDVQRMTFELDIDFGSDLLEDKQGFTYIAHQHVRQRLIQATDNQFSWEIKQVYFREDGAVRKGQNESREPTTMIIIGTLTIPGLGNRDGIGVSEIREGGGADSAYKGAESDALKRAAMAFGVGLRQLYIESQRPSNSAPQQNRSSNNNSGGESRDRSSNQDYGNSNNGGNQSNQQRNQGPRNPNAPASDSQNKYVQDLINKNGWSVDQFNLTDPPLTQGEAHEWIEALKNGNLPEGQADPGKVNQL